MSSFLCTMCGACCRKASEIGLPHKEDGSCVFLKKDNTCKIYTKRPLLCNVEKMYETYDNKMNISQKDFYKMNTSICHDLIDEYNLDDKYKVDLKDYD